MNFNDVSLIFMLFAFTWMLFFSIYVRRHVEYFKKGVKEFYIFSLLPVLMCATIALQQISPIITLNFNFIKIWNILQAGSFFLIIRFIFQFNTFNKILKKLFYSIFFILIIFLFKEINYSIVLFIPSFLMIVISLMHIFMIRNKEYAEKSFFYYILSGIVMLSASYTIKNTLYANIFSQDMLVSILTIYAHFRLSNGILRFYTLQKTKIVHKFYSSVIVIIIILGLFFSCCFLFISHIFGSYVFSVQIICLLFTISFSFIVLLNVYAWLCKKLDGLFYTQENDYFQRLSDCGTYLKKILYVKEFIAFLSGTLNEFFDASHMTIFVLYDDFEDGFRVISSESDKTFRQKEQAELLVNFFNSKKYFQFSDLSEEEEDSIKIKNILKIMSLEIDLNTFIKINHDSTAVYILSFHMKRLISREKLEKIYIKSNIFGDCMDNILLFERKKELLIQKFAKTQKDFDVRELEHENEELQKSYAKIRNLQNDIIKKEREAALTKFTISIDDEISNPLNNMLMAIQYQLEKITVANFVDNDKRDKLLQIIVTQSIRIKNILDELRKVTDDYHKMKH